MPPPAYPSQNHGTKLSGILSCLSSPLLAKQEQKCYRELSSGKRRTMPGTNQPNAAEIVSFFVLQSSKKHSRTGSGPLVLHEQPLCLPPSLRPGTERPHAACQLPSGFPRVLGSSPTTATPKDRSRNTAFPSSLRNQRTSSSAGTSRSPPSATPYIGGDLLQTQWFWAPRRLCSYQPQQRATESSDAGTKPASPSK